MSQRKDIIFHLEQYSTITPLEALQLYGCFRLGARIFELKEFGHVIKKNMIKQNNKWFAEYTLIKPIDLR